MNRTYKILISCILVALLPLTIAFAGNKDRSGQAGAQHLLVDPWAKTNGWGNAGVAEIRGLESIFSNIGGMAFVSKTEVGVNHTRYLTGSNSGISITSFGLAQKIAKRDSSKNVLRDFGTIGVSMFAMNFGQIMITTPEQPEGNMGTFSPNLIYIGVHYAKSFNDFIHGGISIKIVNESISDLSATGVAIDAGVQYQAGAYKNFKIGVALKNIGLPMTYRGDGMSKKGHIEGDADGKLVTMAVRSEKYELPALLAIGISYDFLIFGKEYADNDKKDLKMMGLTRDQAQHRISLAGSFTANSYSRDVFAIGAEYGFMNYFMVRAGYNFEVGMFNKAQDTWYAGPSAGVTIAIPLTKKGSSMQSKLFLDYAYKFTHKWNGNHYIGLKFAL